MNLDRQILQANILIIDDEPLSIRLITQILQKAGFRYIHSINDPRQAVDLYQKVKPDCVILDLNMPHMTGFQVLEELRKISADNYLPVIVISADDNPGSKFAALESGAKDFLNKPYDRVEVLLRIRNLIEVRMLNNQIADQNRVLETKVRERTKELYETQVDVVQRLSRAIEYRDTETGMHVVRMSRYSAILAKYAGLSERECEMILIASPLHDIGKIGIPDNILQKPGKFTDAEFNIMKSHTTIGEELLSGGNSEFLKFAKEIAGSHHEKWNGTGYPRGLKEEAIPLAGRICGLADAFDAITSKRVYKEACSIDVAVEEIKKSSGTHFDPKLVDAFLAHLDEIKSISEKYAEPSKQ